MNGISIFKDWIIPLAALVTVITGLVALKRWINRRFKRENIPLTLPKVNKNKYQHKNLNIENKVWFLFETKKGEIPIRESYCKSSVFNILLTYLPQLVLADSQEDLKYPAIIVTASFYGGYDFAPQYPDGVILDVSIFNSSGNKMQGFVAEAHYESVFSINTISIVTRRFARRFKKWILTHRIN